MQYLLMIYESEAELQARRQTEGQQIMQAYMTFTQDIVKSGHFKGGNALQPIATATTVRVRGGKTMTTDGPFAETREQLTGYYLIEAADLDAATAIAARIPGAANGSIEVRPVWEM